MSGAWWTLTLDGFALIGLLLLPVAAGIGGAALMLTLLDVFGRVRDPSAALFVRLAAITLAFLIAGPALVDQLTQFGADAMNAISEVGQ